MRALESATRRQTTLLVTHQLQAIADFDVVWVMAGGIMAQQGSYADLAACDGPAGRFDCFPSTGAVTMRALLPYLTLYAATADSSSLAFCSLSLRCWPASAC